MPHRAELVELIANGASEADMVRYFVIHYELTRDEIYTLIRQNGISFRSSKRVDDISEERRRFLQNLSLT
jgi:hypothetical protein